MTIALPTADYPPQLDNSLELMKRIIPGIGCNVPAGALTEPGLATWVRRHGVTVTAHDDDELGLARYQGIRPLQIVMRCGLSAEPIRRAIALGVTRFIVTTPWQMGRLAEHTHCAKYIYLGEHSPLALGDRQLKVVGLHTDIDDISGTTEWAGAAERLLCRAALLKTCGASIKRITLSGGSLDISSSESTEEWSAIVGAVDVALREGCERWQLPRPTVSISPSTLTHTVNVAA